MDTPIDELPIGWAMLSLEQLVSANGVFNDGDWVESKDQDPNGSVRLVQLADIGDMQFLDKSHRYMTEERANALNCTFLRKGDLLISRLGDPLGKTCVYPALEDRAVTVVDVCVFRPAQEGIETKLFGYFLNGMYLRQIINAQASGTTRKRITGKKLKVLSVPVPPTNEQQRIVEKIETLFARLDKGEEAVRDVQKLLTQYRQSVLKSAVTGQLTADWRAEREGKLEHGRDILARILQDRRGKWEARGGYKEPFELAEAELAALPDGWTWSTLDQLICHLTSGSRDWKQYYGRGNGTFIMAQNVRPMRFDLSERFQVDPPAESPDAKRSEVRKDDLLITIVGANTGDICRFPLDSNAHYVCQSVALLRPVEAEMSKYLEMYLASKGAGRDELEKFIYGAGRPHLSFEQLRSVPVPLPPTEEQVEILAIVAEHLDKIRKLELMCETELKRSASLRQSILKDAFAGNLVPQDPADEPASDLLARIAADKPTAKKTRRKTPA